MVSRAPQPSYTHAALMGDVVGSENAVSVRDLYGAFNAAIEAANQDAGAKLASPLTITLGDEFQGLCPTLKDGLSVLRSVRERLLLQGIGCRFSLGMVRLETPLNAERAWNMMGPGLAATRERLADKRDPNAYRFELPGEPMTQSLMEAVGAGLSDIERDWTARQREVVLASLNQPAAEVIRTLKISPPTYYKIRRAGRFDTYERQWRALEAAAGSLDEVYGLR